MAEEVKSKQKSTPTMSPEARENQLINLAYIESEKRIRNGTASSQLLTHFLNLGTEKARLENERLKTELKVAEAKIKQLQANEDIKELYENALKAMTEYGGMIENYDEERY